MYMYLSKCSQQVRTLPHFLIFTFVYLHKTELLLQIQIISIKLQDIADRDTRPAGYTAVLWQGGFGYIEA